MPLRNDHILMPTKYQTIIYLMCIDILYINLMSNLIFYCYSIHSFDLRNYLLFFMLLYIHLYIIKLKFNLKILCTFNQYYSCMNKFFKINQSYLLNFNHYYLTNNFKSNHLIFNLNTLLDLIIDILY